MKFTYFARHAFVPLALVAGLAPFAQSMVVPSAGGILIPWSGCCYPIPCPYGPNCELISAPWGCCTGVIVEPCSFAYAMTGTGTSADGHAVLRTQDTTAWVGMDDSSVMVIGSAGGSTQTVLIDAAQGLPTGLVYSAVYLRGEAVGLPGLTASVGIPMDQVVSLDFAIIQVAFDPSGTSLLLIDVREFNLGDIFESGCDSIDFNNDGLFPDSADIDDYLSVFGGGPCSNGSSCGDIDFNNDGLFPDTLDIDSLLSVFSGGACL